MKILELCYMRSIEPFIDQLARQRRQIKLTTIIYYSDRTTRKSNKSLHLTWNSSPDPRDYNVWKFSQCIIVADHTDILTSASVPARGLIQAIATISSETQPQDFERILQDLGYHLTQ